MGIALRSTGSIDFYYDFKLVESWEAESNKRCICIDSDFTDLHFKCYEKSEDPENPYERVVWYACRTSWKQRVGMRSSKARETESLTDMTRRYKRYLRSVQKDQHIRRLETVRKV